MSKFRLKVISINNESWPFMRGMLTHSLVQRGMDFKTAYEVAQGVKNDLQGRETITKYELRRFTNDYIRENLGEHVLQNLIPSPIQPRFTTNVVSEDIRSPFSRGLVARSIMAAGVPPTHAHKMSQELQYELFQKNTTEIKVEDLEEVVLEKILNEADEETADFYRISSRINELDKPVVVYIGGSIGTGKSSLATELASRLNILKVTGTDMIRQIMRMVFTEQILPALHRSSFEVIDNEDFEFLLQGSNVLNAYVAQSVKVIVGVQAVVERAINENTNVILEGVHLLPSLLAFPELMDKAYHIPIVISLNDKDVHYARFKNRQKSATERRAKRYHDNFQAIRTIHDYCVEVALENGVEVINNNDFDRCINRISQNVIMNLQRLIADKSAQQK